MKNITVSVDEDTYHAARIEAAKRQTSVSAMVRHYLQSVVENRDEEDSSIDPELASLFALSDSKHAKKRGSVGSLNRESLYTRGVY